jgi:glycosyltransferase involved in cell wall biosynthesis
MLAPRPTAKGPLPKHTPLLVDALKALGCDVELLPWGQRHEREGIAAKTIGRGRDVLTSRRRIAASHATTVVVKTAHDWLTLARDVPLLISLRRGPLVVVQFHGSQSGRLVRRGSRAFKAMTRLLLRRAHGVLVLSHEEELEWRAFSPETPVVVVRNVRPQLAATLAQGPEPDPRTATVLCVARLIEAKGVLDLVRALAVIRTETPCRLVLVGDGPERDRLLELAREERVAEWVELAGYADDAALELLYRDSTVFALPTSHPEGFPTVILEAMAAGLPVVTTAVRGAADRLAAGENALFVEPRDVAGLAGAISALLADPELCRAMGRANREKVREFEPEPVAREYVGALETIRDARR